MTTIELRPAAPADSEFCFALHHAAMGGYIEQVWGWDEATQRAFHERDFDPEGMRIVTVDGRDAGSISVERQPTGAYVRLIEIHPRHQSQGIGSRLLQDLLDEAAGNGHPVTLDVLVVNDRAHALYRRLGFHDVARHGDHNIKIRMRWEPPIEDRTGCGRPSGRGNRPGG